MYLLIEHGDIKRKIIDLIKLFCMSTITSLYTPVEFWTSRRKHIERDAPLFAGFLKGSFKLTASVNLDSPNGEWRALREYIQKFGSQERCCVSKYMEGIPLGYNISCGKLLPHHPWNGTDIHSIHLYEVSGNMGMECFWLPNSPCALQKPLFSRDEVWNGFS